MCDELPLPIDDGGGGGDAWDDLALGAGPSFSTACKSIIPVLDLPSVSFSPTSFYFFLQCDQDFPSATQGAQLDAQGIIEVAMCEL
jgi:hypothetical protein